MNSWIKEKDVTKIDKLEEKLFGWITPKRLAMILTVVYALSLIPLLIIAKYNFPSADDYGHASSAHLTWLETGNVFATIWAGIQRGIYEWINWEGYYTCDIMTALPPSVFGEGCYWIVTYIVLSMLTISTIYLFHVIFVKVFRYDKYLSRCITMIYLFTSVQCLSVEGRVEAFYWFSGAVNYVFIHSLANFYFGLMIVLAMKCKEKIKCTGRMIGTAVLGFVVAGGNQITMLNVGIILLFAIVMISYHKAWKVMKPLIVPMIVYYVGMMLNMFAPGNDIRAMVSQGMNPIKAIGLALMYGLELCIGDWTSWVVLIAFIIIGVISWKITAHSEFTYPCPLIVILLGYCITSAMMAPSLFAVSSKEAGRIQAVTYFMFLMTSIFSIVYVMGWLRYGYDQIVTEKCNKASDTGSAAEAKEELQLFQPTYRWILVFAAAFLLVGSVLCIANDSHYYAWTSAITDLVSGDATEYQKQMDARLEIMYSGKSGVLELEPLTVHPKLLYFSDITTDVNAWENDGMKRFLGVDGVVLKDITK